MARYFLTGGQQRPSTLLRRDEWHAYGNALLVELDTVSGQARTVLAYQSPPGRRPAEAPNHVFKAASWDGEHLLLCTQTEILVFDPREARVLRTVSHPWLNDVHHVVRHEGRLHVVSTGLDALVVFDDDDDGVAEVISATGRSPWERFERETDYRLVPTTKPHRCHPNYFFVRDGLRWLTRFEQRDALCLDAPERAIPLADDPVHDGEHAAGRLWFTVVSGEVVAVDPGADEVGSRYDLDAIGAEDGHPLGWCRGIHRDADGLTLLAFSRLRPTRLKQNLSWLRGPLGKAPEPRPTRVAAYDLEGGRKVREWVVEDTGLSSIFSILPAEPPLGGSEERAT